MRRNLLIIFFIFITHIAVCQSYSFSGRVLDNRTRKPVGFASVSISNTQLWGIADENGSFAIKKIPAGKAEIIINCLGYAKKVIEKDFSADSKDFVIYLKEDDLSLDEVVVTAQKVKDNVTTTYKIDRNALDHMQILDVSDVMGLLPGGSTNRQQHLATLSEQRIGLQGSNDRGFGTAVEVDGIRLSNNASFGYNDTQNFNQVPTGVDTRKIGSANIESIEVITGIPSVEYGDISNGVVKVNTRKGKTNLIVDLMTKPHSKQVAISKGVALGRNGGILNTGFEYTRSTSDLASPYTAYTRNVINLNYSKSIGNTDSPIYLKASLSGNIGGYDSKADPDMFVNTYTKQKDNNVRGNAGFDWLLNKSWITKLEFSGSFDISNKTFENNVSKSSSTSSVAIHTTEEGYFIGIPYNEDPNAAIILREPGYWYELAIREDKPVNLGAKLKANWAKKIGYVHNDFLFGMDYSRNDNRGRGLYYDDLRYAPTWREYRYNEEPAMNNFAAYAEEKATIPMNAEKRSQLQFIAGLRSDITHIGKSDYGTVSSFSPRFNAKYTFWKNQNSFVEDLGIYAGMGKSVKLPSFAVLYPTPYYIDELAFAPGTLADGTVFYAYHSQPVKQKFNANLKWQSSQQSEIGIEARLKFVNITLSAFNIKTDNPYIQISEYTPFNYKFTDQTALNNVVIPSANRYYTIDRNTGIVTVNDKTGTNESLQLAYKERTKLKSNSYYSNGSPYEKRGFDWVLDFKRIETIRTSFMLNGSYYQTKEDEKTLLASSSSSNMSDGSPYKFVGYYVGSTNATYSGEISRQLNTNFTITTHIPAIRFIISVRLEACFYDYNRKSSSEAFVIDNKDDYLPSTTNTNIYDGNHYVAVYPKYYAGSDDLGTLIPFKEAYLDAKVNNTALYNDLSKLVLKSNRDYTFLPNRLSNYYSSNISITKEIGRIASISFNATNFFNNSQKIRASQTGTTGSIYGSTLIPSFYYGLSLRLKL